MRFDLTAHLGETPRATLVAACLGMSLGALFEGSKYGAAMHEAFERLVASAKDGQLFHDYDRKFAFVARGGDLAVQRNADVLEEIIEALLEDRRVRVDVDHVNAPRKRQTVQPLSLVVYNHQLYLLGRGVNDKEVRAIRVARIKGAKKLGGGTSYPKPDNYDLKKLFGETFGIYLAHEGTAETIRVRIKGKWARFAESHRWHPTQKEVARGPDSIELTLQVRPCPEVEAWVLGFGEWAEVLEPAALRKRVSDQVEKMAATYAAARGRTKERSKPTVRTPKKVPKARAGLALRKQR